MFIWQKVRFFFVFLVCLGIFTTFIAAQEETGSSNEHQVIRVDNAANLELGFALPDCAFSPNWDMMNIYDGLHDIWTGERLFNRGGTFSPDERWLVTRGEVIDWATRAVQFSIQDTGSYDIVFSPDGQLMLAFGGSAYDLENGERLYAVGSQMGMENSISPDSRWLAGDWLYDAETGWQHFPIETAFSTPDFSPDSHLIALMDGIYEVPSGDLHFATEASGPSVFSPDGTLLAAAGDGVYDVTTGERLYAINQTAVFSPDGRLLVVDFNGVYEAATGELHFAIGAYPERPTLPQTASFNLDASLVAIAHDGIYEIETGEKLFEIEEGEPKFSPDGTLLAIRKNTQRNAPGNTGQHCLIYGVQGTEWPQYGFVMASGFTAARPISVNVRRSPNGSVIGAASQSLVFAQNTDASWFKVSFEDGFGWVAASVVDVIFLPEGLPVEEP